MYSMIQPVFTVYYAKREWLNWIEIGYLGLCIMECGFILEGIKFEIIYDMNVLESQKFQNDSHDLPNSTNIK